MAEREGGGGWGWLQDKARQQSAPPSTVHPGEKPPPLPGALGGRGASESVLGV